MSNKIKRLLNRRRDNKDLQVFVRVITSLLKSIETNEFQLRNANYEEPQFDDLMIMLNNQFHERLRLYINHRFATPSQILAAEELLKSSEKIHNGLMGFKEMTQKFIRDISNGEADEYDIRSLSKQDYMKIRESYIDAMRTFALSICNLSHKAFILLSYDVGRLETGVDIIEEYYKSTERPKIKISFNASLTKEDILRNDDKSVKSDKINNVSRKEEKNEFI